MLLYCGIKQLNKMENNIEFAKKLLKGKTREILLKKIREGNNESVDFFQFLALNLLISKNSKEYEDLLNVIKDTSKEVMNSFVNEK